MSRRLPLALLTLLAAALVGGGVALALRGTAPAPAPPAPAVPAPAPPAAVPPGAIEAAVKELDLIRPSRPKTAEDFQAPLLGGGTFRLAEQRGRVVLVNFWATWCPPCREEMPSMERLWRQYRESGFVLVAVSVDGDPAAVAPFVKEHGLTFPVALDPGMDVAGAYGVRALPASFLIDRQGQLVAVALGPRTWDGKAARSLVQALVR